uniref:Uncharacterized protein n=1 Tax=Triticum urartu TaxID=4572 RepID=A0A8R7UJZ8_TRIUA
PNRPPHTHTAANISLLGLTGPTCSATRLASTCLPAGLVATPQSFGSQRWRPTAASATCSSSPRRSCSPPPAPPPPTSSTAVSAPSSPFAAKSSPF